MGCVINIPPGNDSDHKIKQFTKKSIQQSGNNNDMKQDSNKQQTLLTHTTNSISNSHSQDLSIFKTHSNNIKCQPTDMSSCESAKRIVIILSEFTSIISNINNTQSHNKIIESMDKIFMANNYTNSNLLNDFHHLKFEHNVDEDDQQFHEIYSYFKNNLKITCSSSDCQHIRRYCRDRSTLQNDYFMNDKNDTSNDENLQFRYQYTFNLISRIHFYFIHSYEFHRLTLQEIKNINDKLKRSDEIEESKDDENDLEDAKIKITMMIIDMRKKKHKDNTQDSKQKNLKYIDTEDETVSVTKPVINWSKIENHLPNKNDEIISEINIEETLAQYANQEELISDVIDVVYNNKQFPINIKILNNDSEINSQLAHSICSNLLYGHFKVYDLNKNNFIKIAIIVIEKCCLDINKNEFLKTATESVTQIDGKIFDNNSENKLNAAKFAAIFKESMSNYNRKEFQKLYKEIKKWKQIQSEIKIENEENKQMTSENIDVNTLKEIYKTGTRYYEIGKQFYYWKAMKDHKRYIALKYSNLQEEMLTNTAIKFNMRRWKTLQVECKVLYETKIIANTRYDGQVKTIVANGWNTHLYNIRKDLPLSIQHLQALKLYTDYPENSSFCGILRSGNPLQISEIANWAKLLTECVQCFGDRLGKTKYYRGVKEDLIFKIHGVSPQFNLPTSTTTQFIKAAEFSEGRGLVMQLAKCPNSLAVFKFNCSKLSEFDSEKETLFFGGQTVLRISNIYQPLDGWVSHKKYIEAANFILRMMHGISQKKTLSNINQQETMRTLINDIYNSFNCLSSNTPKYIENLLKYSVKNSEIKLNYEELLECQWMHKTFFHSLDESTINVSYIVELFRNSKAVTFIMQNDHVCTDLNVHGLTDCQWISLLEDLRVLSEKKVMIIIKFQWPFISPYRNSEPFDKYYSQLKEINWTCNFSNWTNTISFRQINQEIDSQFDRELMPPIVRATSVKFLFENNGIDEKFDDDIDKPLDYVDENYDSDQGLDIENEDDEQFIKLKSGGQEPMVFQINRNCAELSKFVTTILESCADATEIEIRQVPPETLGYVLEYLQHHNGKEPDPLPCPVRSIHMSEIVSDKWDAIWIDAFDKKTIFEIILAANYMDIKSLLHLGCAKIATLIKQLDQKEINRIIEEEEKYRREHAQDNDQ